MLSRLRPLGPPALWPSAHFPRPGRHWVRGVLTVLAVLAALAAPAFAQGSADEEACPGSDAAPVPTPVAVEAVPIVVTSTPAEYFVLYVSHELDGATMEVPVLVKRGAAGTTMLAERVAALPKERYRVEKYLIADPADVDGDCIDDLTELADPAGMNPVNPAAAIDFNDGAVAIPDRNTFETLAEAGRYMKFAVFGPDTDRPRIYFINTNTHTYHGGFQQALTALGIEGSSADRFNGLLTFHPELQSADGSPGLYSLWIYRVEPFAVNDLFYTLFAATMPMLEDDFAFHVREQLRIAYNDVALYEASRINILLDSDVAPEGDFVPMNKVEGYGLLRAMDLEDSPNPRDVVIYEALPNELPRVAGIITTVAQTPLSHVNLRAVQDGVPNAFIRGALDKPDINALIGHYVHYTVTTDGYTIRAATKPEIDNHYASSRPTVAQTPQRDLSVTEITPLSGIGFGDWDAFGVKAANVAVLRTLDFPEGTVPDGFAIPFSFYDEFMKHNNFYAGIETMLANPDFQSDFDTQESELKKLRKAIEKAETPQWIIDAIVEMNQGFPDGINRRYRSSTNNEDLPGFSGAGLYDSKSQKPSEDEDDLAKSLKEVYASLWNFRAFVERDFHRIDHLTAAMGVLVHPSYQDEKVNGVAVSFDLIAGRFDYYYVNSQVGEDLVTNPDALSVPEEVLLDIYGSAILLGASNQVAPGQRLMSDDQLLLLHDHLFVIHHHFEKLYKPAAAEPFAMEIEFKITSANLLAIKQARPWVFSTEDAPSSPPPPTPPATSAHAPPTGSGGAGGGGGGSRPQDQHGNSPTRATRVVLGPTAPWPSATTGQLNTTTDVDYFTLSIPHAGLLVVETTGSTDTVGTVWQDDEELATADSGGPRRNFRLRVPVLAGSVVIAVEGPRAGAYTLETRLVVGLLENPGPASFQSGVGVISGWVCEAETVEIEIAPETGAAVRYVAAYGTERLDTARRADGTPVCGDTDNGFGLLFNWNRLGDGEHTVVALVDGEELGRATVTVTTLGAEFLRDVAGTCVVDDFPSPGETVTLVWQQNSQNFVITDGSAPSGVNRAGTPDVGYLENPGPNSFQSGVGVLSGWVCEADAVTIAIGHLGRQGAGYGTERLDTEDACGDTGNGFGLLFNWNRLGEGEHEVVAYVDDEELGRATVRVTTLGEEFVRGAEGMCEVTDFPLAGQTVTLEWQQNSQNFVVTAVD